MTLALPRPIFETARRWAEQSNLTIAALCERLVVEALTSRDEGEPSSPTIETSETHGEHEIAIGAFSETLDPLDPPLPIWDQPGAIERFEALPALAESGTTETPRSEPDRETLPSTDAVTNDPDSDDSEESSPYPPEAAQPIPPPAWIGTPPQIRLPQAPSPPPSPLRSDPPPITWRLPGEDEKDEEDEDPSALPGSAWQGNATAEQSGSNSSVRVILTPEDSDDELPHEPGSGSASLSSPIIEFEEAPMTPSGDELETPEQTAPSPPGHAQTDPTHDRDSLRAIELVLRHAGPGARDPLALLPALRRGEMIPPQAARDLLDALQRLEHALAGRAVIERRLAFALHRLAFEGQILLTDADHWRGGVETEVVEVLRMVQEGVDRVISGQDIRYYQAD